MYSAMLLKLRGIGLEYRHGWTFVTVQIRGVCGTVDSTIHNQEPSIHSIRVGHIPLHWVFYVAILSQYTQSDVNMV